MFVKFKSLEDHEAVVQCVITSVTHRGAFDISGPKTEKTVKACKKFDVLAACPPKSNAVCHSRPNLSYIYIKILFSVVTYLTEEGICPGI